MLTKKATVLDHLPFTIEPERVLREMRVPHIKTIDQIEEKPLAESIKKAIDKEICSITIHDLRDQCEDRHKQVDDSPYGGGPGMVFKRKKSGRVRKLRLLQVSLTIQHTPKVNISDNNVNFC